MGTKVELATTRFIAGLVATMKTETTAELSNFAANVTVVDSCNIAGAVYSLNASGSGIATVKDLELLVTAKSINLKDYNVNANYSTTRKVAGAIGNMYNNSILKNVNVEIRLNENVNKEETYGAAIFGGLVAHLFGNYVEIDSCGVNGTAYMNEGNYYLVSEAGENKPKHYLQIAGGLIGLIATAEYNSIVPVPQSKAQNGMWTKITNNVVKNLTITVDGEFDNGVDNIDIFFAVRGVGALVGNINNNYEDITNVLDLSTNKMENVQVSANVDAFTFIKVKSESTELFSLIGAGNDIIGYKAVGMLKEIIDRDALDHTLNYIIMPERTKDVETDTYTDYVYIDTTEEVV